MENDEIKDHFHTLGMMLLGAIVLVVGAAILNASIGYLYFTYAPLENFIVVRSFTVPAVHNMSQDNSHTQIYTIDRTVYRIMTADAIDKLTLLKNDNTPIIILSIDSGPITLEEGDMNISKVLTLPDNLEPGKYQWQYTRVYKLPTNVERISVFYSNEFQVIK